MNTSTKARLEAMDPLAKERAAIEKLARIQVERELELRVLYAVGDEAGPLANEISLGVASRRSLAGALEIAQRWRSEKLMVHFQHVIQGEAVLLRLRAAIEDEWRKDGRAKRGSWWRVGAYDVARGVRMIAESETVPLLTEQDAVEMEEKRFMALMEKFSGV